MLQTHFLVAFLVTILSLTALAENPNGVKIEGLSYNGSGCPIGTASTTIAPDGSALSVLFDQFNASTESGGTRDYKACSVDVQLTIPNGWSFAVLKTQVRGFANIASSALGFERSRYTFGARRLQVSEETFRGPYAQDFLLDNTSNPAGLVFSPCGGGRNLSITTNLEVQGTGSSITMDSVDGALSQKYHLNWRRCTGTETIGPKPMALHPSQVRVVDVDSGRDLMSIQAYAQTARVGVRMTACDLNGDGTADLVTIPADGLPTHVRVFDGRNGQQLNHPLGSFFAYDPSYNIGGFVACGDIDGDGRKDLITGAGNGGGPHVKVFSGVTGREIKSFFAFEAAFRGGVSVAAGDVNGDGREDIITGAGPNGGPRVTVFDGRTGGILKDFMAYDPGIRSGVRVAAGDINHDGIADLITGAGYGGGPHVKVFNGRTLGLLQNFFAYDAGFRGGVSVASGDVDGDGIDDVITAAGKSGGPHIKVISGATGLALEGWNGSFFGYDFNSRAGVEVAFGRRAFFIAPASGT